LSVWMAEADGVRREGSKANLFRPWGYQPGHFTEWAKLLLQLERHKAHLQRDGGRPVPSAFGIALFHRPPDGDSGERQALRGVASD